MQQTLAQIAILAIVLISAADAAAQDGHPLFQSDEALKAVLSAPITQAYAQKTQDVRIYFPGQWTYINGDGEPQRLEVSIRTRGDFRRHYCNLPPLQLNFRKSQVKGTLFKGQDKLKLVAPCNHGARYQQYVILEYLAYRTFQILSDYSFRTRLMRLSYVDADEKRKPWTDMVFAIEDNSDMARRLDLDTLKLLEVAYEQLDHPKTALVQLFQFLIANNDYSVLKSEEGYCCHNIEVIGDRDSGLGRVPVPFDFDMSGLVNATYAAPPEQVPVIDVRERYFYGLCQPDDILDAAIAHVQLKKSEIVALFANSKELDQKNKRKSLEYIEDFYDVLDNPKRMRIELLGRCRGRSHMERMLEASTGST